ncbi:MAG: glycosyltransferase family 2 protein [Rhodospirillaceae bacterium]
MTIDASIIIVNYNAGAHLRRCVASLKAQTVPAFEMFVIDNASTDSSLIEARTEIGDDPRFTIVELADNTGFAAANNHGAELASAPLIVTLNPDAFPEPDWLKTLLAAAVSHPDVAMFGSTQLNAARPERIDGAGDRYFAGGIPWREQNDRRLKAHVNSGIYDTFAPCAAAAMYRADAFHAVGGFDPRFFCFVEDVDLGYRLRRRGHRCLQVAAARVHHVGGGAGGGTSDFARYHGTRNLIWCFFKNTPGVLWPLLVPLHLAVLMVLAMKAVLRGRAGPTLRGIRDGLAGIGLARDAAYRTDRASGGMSNVMKAMDWSLLAYLRRG